MTASAGGRELSQRLAKIETAISRRKTIQFSYYTMERDATDGSQGRSLPPRLPLRPVLSDRLRARARRGPRLPALADPGQGLLRRARPSTTSTRPAASTAATTRRAPTGRWARRPGTARIFLRDRIDWLVERDYGDYGRDRAGRQRRREARQGLGLRDRLLLLPPARRLVARLAPERQRDRAAPSCASEAEERARDAPQPPLQQLQDRQARRPPAVADAERRGRSNGKAETVIRPERFARLVTLAGMLIDSARNERQLLTAEVCSELGISGQGAARATSTCSTSSTSAAAPTSSTPRSSATRSRSTPRPTATTSPARPGCCRSRRRPWSPRSTSSATTCRRPACTPPARRSSPRSATTPPRRGWRSRSSGDEPEIVSAVNDAIADHAGARAPLLQGERGPVHQRARSSPTGSTSGPEGWYVGCHDLTKRDAVRHFQLDRIKEAEPTERAASSRARGRGARRVRTG